MRPYGRASPCQGRTTSRSAPSGTVRMTDVRRAGHGKRRSGICAQPLHSITPSIFPTNGISACPSIWRTALISPAWNQVCRTQRSSAVPTFSPRLEPSGGTASHQLGVGARQPALDVVRELLAADRALRRARAGSGRRIRRRSDGGRAVDGGSARRCGRPSTRIAFICVPSAFVSRVRASSSVSPSSPRSNSEMANRANRSVRTCLPPPKSFP